MFAQGMMLGDSFRITMVNATVTDFEISPNNAFAEIEIQADGDVVERNSDGAAVTQQWIAPVQFAGADIHVTASVLSGPTPSGSAIDTPLPMSSTRSWRVTESGIGTQATSLLLRFTNAVSGAVLGSAVVGLTAIVDV